MSKTLYQKIWDSHLVREKERENSLLYIDLHLVHEVTSPQAFAGLRLQKRKVRCASNYSSDYGSQCSYQTKRYYCKPSFSLP